MLLRHLTRENEGYSDRIEFHEFSYFKYYVNPEREEDKIGCQKYFNDGAREYLESDFRKVAIETIDENKQIARLGGHPNTTHLWLSYIRVYCYQMEYPPYWAV